MMHKETRHEIEKVDSGGWMEAWRSWLKRVSVKRTLIVDEDVR